VQLHVPLKLRQQRTFVLHLPIARQLDVLHCCWATSAGRSWPPVAVELCAAVPE
jgi:hypothetical protein